MSNEFFRNKKVSVITEYLKNIPKNDRKRTLIMCIENHGFIKENVVEEEEIFDFPEQFKNEDGYRLEEVYNEIELRPGLNQSYSASQRTFIEDNKLSKVQRYIISNEETELSKIGDIIENVLNALNASDFKKDALDMYIYIKNNSERFGFPEPKASLKQGYIILCIYYTLIKVMCVNILNIQSLTGYIGVDINTADYNMHVIFEENKNYQFIFNVTQQEKCLCGMKPFLLQQFDKPVVDSIDELIKEMQKRNVFNKPATHKEISAAIYYIAVKKNGKIKMKNGKYLTYKDIKNYCNVTDDTVKKTVDLISSALAVGGLRGR
jgi:hypothetical protein